jgi:hypothetical protein
MSRACGTGLDMKTKDPGLIIHPGAFQAGDFRHSRKFSPETIGESVQGAFLTLNQDFDPLAGVLYLALQSFILSQTIDKRPEAHTLDQVGENKAQGGK